MPIVIIALLVAFDQITKRLAFNYLKPLDTIPIIDGFLNLTYVANTGAAFGIFQGKRWAFVALTIVVLILMLLYYRSLPKTKPHSYLRFTIILIAAGAIGNLIDRALNGYVVDFLHFTFINFPVFNVADCYVSIGACLVVILSLFVIKD